MSPPNGHANGSTASGAANEPVQTLPVQVPRTGSPNNARFSAQEVRDLCAALEVPFDPKVINWRVTNTSKNGKLRGQVIPYADQRAYTDRLNQLFTPAGWTRRYNVHTSANFERSKDQKNVAKVFVTCELRITGLGMHSATGEQWSDDENAVTSAEAQAFKRSCACYGVGRYLYHFDAVWVDLDDRKRPKNVPKLPGWATPDGWQRGLRPNTETTPTESMPRENSVRSNVCSEDTQRNDMVLQIEKMARPLGRRLYRGLLRTEAMVWSPSQIADPALRRKVLERMQSAERGFERLRIALDKTGPAPLNGILQSLKLRSLEMIDTLETLKRVVLAIEAAASSPK